MSIFSKRNDEWVEVHVPRVLRGDRWVACKAVYANVSGVWKPVWMKDNVEYLPVLRQDVMEVQDVRTCAA